LTHSFRQTLSCAWPALLLAAACLLPFLHKPYLIDDPHFLKMAAHIVASPLHPMDFTVCWNIGERCMKAYELTPGNALMGYALVPAVLFGAPEWAAHLTQMAFCFVALLAMASFTLRLGYSPGEARLGALLLAAIPPFLPLASTAMPDVLALCLAVLAMERLSAWKQQRLLYQGIAAALALGLAGFARSHLALLLPLAAFFLLEGWNWRSLLAHEQRAFSRWRQWLRDLNPWLPVVGGALLLMLLILGTRERGLALDPPARVSGLQYVQHNLLSYFFFLGFPLPLAAVWALRQAHARLAPVAIVLGGAFAAAFVRGREWSIAIVAAAALAHLLVQAIRKRDAWQLTLLLWLLIPLPVVYYGHLPIKYLLPVLPAAILLVLRMLQALPRWQAQSVGGGLVLAGVAYSCLILSADADFARFGRSAVESLVRPQVAAGNTVWYGSDFSFYWYAPQAGARLIDPGKALSPGGPRPGDLLLMGSYEGGILHERFPRRTLVQSLQWEPRYGVTMGRGVGLYSNNWGLWLWGRDPDNGNRWELWRIDVVDSQEPP
jgi:hypothetical protein